MSGSTHYDDFHRREPRYKLVSDSDARVLVQPQGSPEPLDAQLIDMSNSGLQLRVQTCLKFDEQMAVHILAGELQFDLSASVKWIRQGDDKSWCVGCHIKPELSEDALTQLATLGLLDRRVSTRREVQLAASICGELEATKSHVTIRNLSEDGFGVATPVARVVGQRIRVAVDKPLGDTIDITARVIWQIKTHDGYFCGCSFLNRQHQAELSALADSKENGEFDYALRGGGSKRRTSLWVALAAVVVFVFPSAIVLLMDEQVSPLAESPATQGRKTTAQPEVQSERPQPVAKPVGPVKEPTASELEVQPEILVDPVRTPAATPDAALKSASNLEHTNNDVANSKVTLAPIFELFPSTSAEDQPLPLVFKASEPDGVELPADAPSSASAESPSPPADSTGSQVVIEPVPLPRPTGKWLAERIDGYFKVERAIAQIARQTAAVSQRGADAVNDAPALTQADDASNNSLQSAEATAPADVFRTWTDSTGTYRVLAKIVALQDGIVKLLKDNGKFTSVPIERLSTDDAEFARKWAETIH